MITHKTSATRTDTAVTISPICQSRMRHKMTDPSAMNGERTTRRMVMATALCIWVTSFATRVTKDAAPTLSISL